MCRSRIRHRCAADEGCRKPPADANKEEGQYVVERRRSGRHLLRLVEDWSTGALPSSVFKRQLESLMTGFEKPTLGDGTEANERLTEPTSLAPKRDPRSTNGQPPQDPDLPRRQT